MSAPGAAPPAARVRAQLRMELRLLLRNGENLLVTLGIPLGLLAFFSLVPVLPTAGREPVAFLLPGILVVAVMGAALVSLAISTGFERHYLVLKRLGATPLRRRELLTAKIAAIATIEVGQVTLLLGTALALGWRPSGEPLAGGLLLIAALVLGTAAFAGVGLAMAGSLPALSTLAIANAVFLLLVLTSGLVFPLEVLPGVLQALASLLPAAPTALLLDHALGGRAGPLAPAITVLVVWAVGAPALAARLFRWE